MEDVAQNPCTNKVGCTAEEHSNTCPENPANQITITFDVNAPKGDGITAPTLEPAAKKAYKNIALGNDFFPNTSTWSITGYTFDGWAEKADATAADKVDGTAVYTKDQTLYGIWTKNAGEAETKTELKEIVDDVTGEKTTVQTAVTTVTISKEQAEEAAKSGTINVGEDTNTPDTNAADVVFTADDMDNLAAGGAPVAITGGRGKFIVQAADIAKLAALNKPVTFEIGPKKEIKIADVQIPDEDEEAEIAVAERVDVNLVDEEGNALPLTSDGGIEVSVKTSMEKPESPKVPAVWYLNVKALEDQGTATLNGGMMSWTAKHFSPYVFGSKIVIDENSKITDKALPQPTSTGMGYTYEITTNGASALYDIVNGTVHHMVLLSETPTTLKISLSNTSDKLTVYVGEGLDFKDGTGFVWGDVDRYT